MEGRTAFVQVFDKALAEPLDLRAVGVREHDVDVVALRLSPSIPVLPSHQPSTQTRLYARPWGTDVPADDRGDAARLERVELAHHDAPDLLDLVPRDPTPTLISIHVVPSRRAYSDAHLTQILPQPQRDADPAVAQSPLIAPVFVLVPLPA